MLTSRSEFGKTFTTAMWLLGTLAAIQMFAVGWAIVTRPVVANVESAGSPTTIVEAGSQQPSVIPADTLIVENSDPFAARRAANNGGGIRNDSPLPPMPQLPALPSLSNGGIGAAAPQIFSSGPVTGPVATPPPASLDDSLLPGPSFNGIGEFQPLSTALSNAAIASQVSQPIANPEIENLVASGAELRGAGNMQASLNALRQAEAVLPEHPRILSEIAATYSEMGLVQKATIYWKKVREMGITGASAYQDLATRELSGDRLNAPAARSLLRLGRITATPDPAALEGERVVVRVEVEADPAIRPNSADMAMLVYFYDRVNGTKTEASTADTTQNFISAPYDWQESGSEVIEVAYHQPVLTPEQKRELGERRFYGYIIELYYRDELQDTAADPPDLSSLDPSAPPTPAERPIGPDGSLFPTTSEAQE